MKNTRESVFPLPQVFCFNLHKHLILLFYQVYSCEGPDAGRRVEAQAFNSCLEMFVLIQSLEEAVIRTPLLSS